MTEVSGEIVAAKGVGTTIAFDGSTVTIKRNWTSGHRRGSRVIPISQISGVDFRRAGWLLAGAFTLVIPGGIESRKMWSGSRHERRNENTIGFHKKANKDFELLRTAILDAL